MSDPIREALVARAATLKARVYEDDEGSVEAAQSCEACRDYAIDELISTYDEAVLAHGDTSEATTKRVPRRKK